MQCDKFSVPLNNMLGGKNNNKNTVLRRRQSSAVSDSLDRSGERRLRFINMEVIDNL